MKFFVTLLIVSLIGAIQAVLRSLPELTWENIKAEFMKDGEDCGGQNLT